MSFGFASKSSDKLLSGIVRFLFVKAAVSESTTVFHTHATDRRQCGVAGCGGATNPGAAASHLPGRCHPHRRSRLRPCDHHQPGLHDLSVHIAFGHAVERPAGACNAPQQRPLLIWQDRPALAIPANFACFRRKLCTHRVLFDCTPIRPCRTQSWSASHWQPCARRHATRCPPCAAVVPAELVTQAATLA